MSPRPWYLDMRDWLLNSPTAQVYAWVFSQPPGIVIGHLREHPELWDALCEEIGNNVREGCAVIAEEYFSPATWHYAQDQPYTIGREIAAAIRARGEGTDE